MTEDKLNRLTSRIGLALILNVLISVGLIILYVLYFGKEEKSESSPKQQMNSIQSPTGGGVNVAFVNTDVLLERYELVKQMASEFDKEQRKRDTDLQKRTKQYEEEAAYFQESVQNQSLSEESAQRIYEQLMVKQQELYELQQKYSNELAQQEFEMNKVLLDTVKNYLDRINIEKNFDYILNYTIAGPILLAKDTFDITEFVLRGLNKEYKDLYDPENEN
ncbi:MAG: OmpH family outer membrane protein [Bacteroidetes bacterium]|nr:OmpH family outer membrane protein [Bacteroidota bacterium]